MVEHWAGTVKNSDRIAVSPSSARWRRCHTGGIGFVHTARDESAERGSTDLDAALPPARTWTAFGT